MLGLGVKVFVIVGVIRPLCFPAPPVLNRIPDFVVAIVFGCFTLLILVVSACCWIGVVLSKYTMISGSYFYLVWFLLICYCEIMCYTLVSGRREYGEKSL